MEYRLGITAEIDCSTGSPKGIEERPCSGGERDVLWNGSPGLDDVCPHRSKTGMEWSSRALEWTAVSRRGGNDPGTTGSLQLAWAAKGWRTGLEVLGNDQVRLLADHGGGGRGIRATDKARGRAVRAMVSDPPAIKVGHLYSAAAASMSRPDEVGRALGSQTIRAD